MADDPQLDADRLDEAITAVLAGRPAADADATVLWLAASARPTPPSGLTRRLARSVERVERARGLGEAHSVHPYVEGGIALIVLAFVVAAGFLDRRALPISVGGGGAVGIAYGINGLGEIGQFAAGVALHMTELVAAVALVVLWWRARRYGRGDPDEGGA